MKRFIVGKRYESYDSSFDTIVILKRTDKTIWVDKDGVRWMMRIRKDHEGNEFAVDSSVPPKWRYAFTYSAEWPVE